MERGKIKTNQGSPNRSSWAALAGLSLYTNLIFDRNSYRQAVSRNSKQFLDLTVTF